MRLATARLRNVELKQFHCERFHCDMQEAKKRIKKPSASKR
ncbi:MAG: hypothetical protein OCU24_06445 [Candidatus Methanospirare jalkutatii]|nr:hypothetical protein [Candidatus Methanospirare jalkutatii]